DLARLAQHFEQMRAGHVIRAESRLRRKDGTSLPVELASRQLPDGGFQAFMRDMSERNAAEQALRDSETRLAAVFRSSPAAIVVTTLSGGFLDVNAEFERVLGYPRDEVIGRTVFEVGLWAELADRERIIGPLATQRAVHNVETRFRHKSGSLIDVQVSL